MCVFAFEEPLKPDTRGPMACAGQWLQCQAIGSNFRPFLRRACTAAVSPPSLFQVQRYLAYKNPPPL